MPMYAATTPDEAATAVIAALHGIQFQGREICAAPARADESYVRPDDPTNRPAAWPRDVFPHALERLEAAARRAVRTGEIFEAKKNGSPLTFNDRHRWADRTVSNRP